MTNRELKEFLEKMLAGDAVSDVTVTLLMDACIHAALKTKFELLAVSAAFSSLAAGHSLMHEMLGIPVDGFCIKEEALGAMGEAERKMLENLLGDMKLDL